MSNRKKYADLITTLSTFDSLFIS